jgi:hypothetical protein
MGTKNRRKIIEHVASLDNFVAGNVRGGWYPTGEGLRGTGLGQLAPEHVKALTSIKGPVYVVWSYQTPIAWRPAGGSWVDPGDRYSVTTPHHQSLTRQGMRGWDSKCEAAVTHL